MILPDAPFRVEFEVDSACNLNCTYCYAKPFNYFTPSFERLEFLFNKTKQEANPFEVVLVGGEPFLRKDFIGILERASEIFGGVVGTSTNGTMFSILPEEKLEKLRVLTAGNIDLQVSLDSVNADINSKTRGATEKVIAGLDTLEKHAIRFGVGIVLTKENANDVMHTVSYLLDTYTMLKRINLEPLRPTFILGKRYIDLKLDGNRTIGIYNGVKRLVAESGRQEVKIAGVVESSAEREEGRTLLDTYRFKQCFAGLLRAGVFTDGSVTPCLALRTESLGNLYKESWLEIWIKAKENFTKTNVNGGQCIVNVLRKEATKEVRLTVPNC